MTKYKIQNISFSPINKYTDDVNKIIHYIFLIVLIVNDFTLKF